MSSLWIPRSLSTSIKNSAASRPVVLLTGVRQSGKSSLLTQLFPKAEYVSFDDISLAQSAEESPKEFLSRFSEQTILDEIQNAPSLFRELKIVVDKNRSNYGKWLLTGSQKFPLMESVSESLAGRVSVMHLETLSARELRESRKVSKEKLSSFLWLGGYPELWSNPQLEPEQFFKDYIQTCLERDVRQILNVANLRDFQRFIIGCAARVGQLLDSDIAKDVGVTPNTVKSWISVLEASGIIALLPPYYRNLGKRLVKAPKLYFADHGLLCHFLGITDRTSWQKHVLGGNVWENLVFSEILKARSLEPGKELFFFRDQNGVEIDFLTESKGLIELIEAKRSEHVDERKLNFSKVAPLFKKQEVRCLVASLIAHERPLSFKNFTSLNPLLTSPTSQSTE